MESKESGKLNWIIGAGIVGADIGTSVFYGTGILFPIVGYLAPVFVLTTCLMMWLFKKTYEEGLALSPYNGGAYSMILRTVGRRLAVVAGALTFVSYLATAAVSALSGAKYFGSLPFFGGEIPSAAIVLLSFIPIILFGLLNTKGIEEPAKLVTGVAAFHFFLLIVMEVWGLFFIGFNYETISWDKFQNLTPTGELTFTMLLYGFSAAFLGITGFESAAQIVEELETPTLQTVEKLYRTVIILVSITAPVVSLLCLVILTGDEVKSSLDYLLSALASKIGGQALVYVIVIDATLTLFAAVNTAFVGFIGLATTMAKQGNLPSVLLYRVAHKFPDVKGYPLIAIPFAVVACTMSALVAGEVEVVAKVYEIAFLGVMVSFCLGVLFMRNQSFRRNIPKKFLSNWVVQIGKKWEIPIIPLASGLVLGCATMTLLLNAHADALLMLTVLFCSTLLAMAYFRWGILETRLERRSDLRLGIGKFSAVTDLPEDLPNYVLCTGGTGARRLINNALKAILAERSDPFELIVFHAEDGKDPEGFFFELLQRVVSQQIAPIYNEDFILTVKILPGSLSEGLQTLKKTIDFQTLLFGSGKNPYASQKLGETISTELEIDVIHLSKS